MWPELFVLSSLKNFIGPFKSCDDVWTLPMADILIHVSVFGDRLRTCVHGFRYKKNLTYTCLEEIFTQVSVLLYKLSLFIQEITSPNSKRDDVRAREDISWYNLVEIYKGGKQKRKTNTRKKKIGKLRKPKEKLN